MSSFTPDERSQYKAMLRAKVGYSPLPRHVWDMDSVFHVKVLDAWHLELATSVSTEQATEDAIVDVRGWIENAVVMAARNA